MDDNYVNGHEKEPQWRDEKRRKLFAERISIGYEQARQWNRLAEIRQELCDLEDLACDG